jgi:hypothetical protein
MSAVDMIGMDGGKHSRSAYPSWLVETHNKKKIMKKMKKKKFDLLSAWL